MDYTKLYKEPQNGDFGKFIEDLQKNSIKQIKDQGLKAHDEKKAFLKQSADHIDLISSLGSAANNVTFVSSEIAKDSLSSTNGEPEAAKSSKKSKPQVKKADFDNKRTAFKSMSKKATAESYAQKRQERKEQSGSSSKKKISNLLFAFITISLIVGVTVDPFFFVFSLIFLIAAVNISKQQSRK